MAGSRAPTPLSRSTHTCVTSVGAPVAPQLADRLLKLLLAERSLLPVEPEVDQPVEFVQFSANTRTLLAPQDDSVPTPEQLDSVTKLRGVEFHHFAAFYKSSWRAWDWMWGRLDGSGWLVHILLDPRRILAVAEDQPDAFPEGKRAATFAALLRETVGLPDRLARRLPGQGPGIPGPAHRGHPGQPAQFRAVPRAGLAGPHRG